MASSNNVTKNNTANKYAAVNRYAISASNSGWGTLAPSIAQTSSLASTTLAEYLKESSAYSNPMAQHHHLQQQQQLQLQQQHQLQQQQQQQQHQQQGPSTSLPWAAAVKAAEQHQFNHLQNAVANRSAAAAVASNAFESRTNTIGSWSSPETSSSIRSGWNTDGSMKGDGIPDDGTAIWGNPSTKKTGIDWTEKESLLNPPQVSNENSEKRIQKAEPVVSSINGTEAWGTPSFGGASNSMLQTSASNSQQQSKSNDNSGNTYGTKTTINNHEPIGWNESSSLQGNNESSSPPSNSIWNQLANNGKQQQQQQKSTPDWMSSYSSTTASSSIVGDGSRSRIDELSKQLEATSLFNSISPTSSLAKSVSSTSTSAGNNTNYNNQSIAINNSTNNVISAGPVGAGSSGNNSITDLKQLSANFFNDLLDSSSRSSGGTLASSNNNSKSQMNAAHPLGITPSRELLKQMVHQIQLAVQAGHINAQILNQPMSTPTLQLVYTLLQQIRLLQQFQEIQQRTVSKSNDINTTNLDLQINRVQQNISLLQKAITQQQAALTKNDSLVDPNPKHQQQQQQLQQQQQQQQQQQEANNFSYANISKLSTNMKVPSNNISNLMSNNSIDSFKRSSLIDTLPSSSNSEQSQRSAQATIDANAPIDKTVSPILQTSVNDIFNGRAQQQQSFASQQQQQAQKAGLLSAHPSSSSSSSSSNAAWSAFNSSDLVSTGWPRISTNITQQDQQQQLSSNSDLMSEIFKARGWGGGNDGNKEMNPPMSLAPGANIAHMARPNSASSNLKQMSETNDILNNKDQSSFYDWGNSSNNSDSLKRNFEADTVPTSSPFSPSAIGGLSLQSNPWLFAPNSLSLNAASGMDNSIGDGKGKMHNNVGMDKAGGDALNFLRSTSSANNMQQQQQRSSLYDWSNIGSSASQFDSNSSPIGSKQNSACGNAQTTAAIGSSPQGGRPAPPPGILSGFGPMTSSVNDVPNMDSNNLRRSVAESQAPASRESAASLWSSGAWFD